MLSNHSIGYHSGTFDMAWPLFQEFAKHMDIVDAIVSFRVSLSPSN
jgi:hypothetical protein